MTDFPIDISFRNMDHSDAVEGDIRDKIATLERFFDRIIDCRIVVHAPHKHSHKGGLYDVRINISVPGQDIVVNRTGSRDHAHEDVYVAIRDAFDAAVRKLEDHVRKARGDIKHHDVPLHGRIRTLLAEQDYGFIETSTGEEVYFHKNSLIGADFNDLEVGAEVRVEVAYGESAEGPQASTVKLMGKHHLTDPD